MRKKTLIVIGVFLAFLVIQGCTSAPEKTLLKKYFNAVMMNDNDTMSSMALEPLQPELGSWSVVSIGPEKVEPATYETAIEVAGARTEDFRARNLVTVARGTMVPYHPQDWLQE